MIKFSCVCFWNRDHYIDGQFMVQKSVYFEKKNKCRQILNLTLFCTHRKYLFETWTILWLQTSIDLILGTLYASERISTEITHHGKSGRPVSQIGSWWCNWMQKLFAPPSKTPSDHHHHVPREKTACKIWATWRASPRALLENLPTIQRGVFATALRGKSGQKRQKQLQQRPKTAPRTTRTSPSMAPNHPRALRDQISQRENGLSHLMRAGRERKKEKEVSERNVQGHCTAQAARREN